MANTTNKKPTNQAKASSEKEAPQKSQADATVAAAEADARRQRELKAREEEAKRIEEEAAAEAEKQAAEAVKNARTAGDAEAAHLAEAARHGIPTRLEETGSGEDDGDLNPADYDDTLFVMDLTARDRTKPRTHTHFFDDQPVDFHFIAGEKLELPFAHACRFLIDPAFVVTDHKGNLIKPSPKRVKTEDVKALQPHQVIAELRELTNEALFIRAVKFDGGHALTRASPRDEIINFLMAAHEKIDTGPGGAREKTFDGEYEDMDDDMARKLLAS